MEPFLIKIINQSKTYTKHHISLINEALENIDEIINSEHTPRKILEKLYQERLQMLKQISKINGNFH